MLPWYVGEYKPKTSLISFETSKHVLINAEKPNNEKRLFGKINNMTACRIDINGWKTLEIKKFGDLGVSKTLRRINKHDLLVWCDFNLLHPSVEADKNSAWSAIETSYPFRKYMNDAVFEVLNSGRWEELNKSACLTVKHRNPENLILQHIPIREKIYKNNKLEVTNRSRTGIIIDTLNCWYCWKS